MITKINEFKVSLINESLLSDIKDKAQTQYEKVKNMTFTDAMKESTPGMNEFRLIYECVDWLNIDYSKEEKKDIKILYSNYSYLADNLFREKMEEFCLPENVDPDLKKYMFQSAWSSGHSSGYSEIYSYYLDVIEKYDEYIDNKITYDEFYDYLDI